VGRRPEPARARATRFTLHGVSKVFKPPQTVQFRLTISARTIRPKPGEQKVCDHSRHRLCAKDAPSIRHSSLWAVGASAALRNRARLRPRPTSRSRSHCPRRSPTSFEAFRKQIADIAGKKDRAAWRAVVAQKFFWIPEDKDVADASKAGSTTSRPRLVLKATTHPAGPVGRYAQETTADPHPQQTGAICGPGEPAFDDKAAEDSPRPPTPNGRMGLSGQAGIEVRSALNNRRVTEKRACISCAVPGRFTHRSLHGDSLRIKKRGPRLANLLRADRFSADADLRPDLLRKEQRLEDRGRHRGGPRDGRFARS